MPPLRLPADSGNAFALARFLFKEVFDDAVFQRMEGNHGQTAARFQNGKSARQSAFQFAQFVVDGDSQGLKSAGCRIRLSRFFENNLIDDLGQLPGGGDRRGLTGFDDFAAIRRDLRSSPKR